jgi:hypothetical protein
MRIESQVDPFAARSAADGLEPAAAAYLERARAGSAVDLAAASMFSLRHASAAAAAGETAELPRRLRTAGQCAAALFSLARGAGGPLDAPVGTDEAVHLSGVVDASTAHGQAWLQGFWCALAVRDLESLLLLAATPVALLRASPSKGDEHLYLTAVALRAWVTGDPATEERFVEALEATDPNAATLAGVDYALDVRVPELELIFGLLDRDAPAFEASLVKALELHVRYWSASSRRDDPDAMLALGSLALAAEAHDSGVPFDVQSPYIPAAVIALGPPERVVCCPYCVTPIATGTRTCPACLEDVTRDAPLEFGGRELRGLPRRPCGSCGFRVPEIAVRCAACRVRL